MCPVRKLPAATSMKLTKEVGKRKLRNKFRRAKGVVQDNQEEEYSEPCRLGMLDWWPGRISIKNCSAKLRKLQCEKHARPHVRSATPDEPTGNSREVFFARHGLNN